MDQKNAHIRILVHEYPDASALSEYTAQREEILNDVSRSADVACWVAKELFIRLTYGGSIRAWKVDHNVREDLKLPGMCYLFQEAIESVKVVFEADPSKADYIRAAQLKNRHSGKPWENTALALYLQTREAEIMVAAIDFLQRKGIPVASLIHDGVLIPVEKIQLVDLAALNAAVKSATGLPAEFAVKPLELDEEDEAWKRMVEEHFHDPEAAWPTLQRTGLARSRPSWQPRMRGADTVFSAGFLRAFFRMRTRTSARRTGGLLSSSRGGST